jgi:hypothetical protein
MAQPTHTHVVEIDEAELVCRMIEAYERKRRPGGISADALLAGIDAETRDDWLRVSLTVRRYLCEIMERAQRVQ